MDAERYKEAVRGIGLVARLAENLELSEVLDAISRAETIGPFADPTLFLRLQHDALASADLRLTEELANALLRVQRLTREHREKFEALFHERTGT